MKHIAFATALFLAACSGEPDVTIEKVEVNVPRLPPVTINPVITLPAACDGGAEEVDGG